MLVLPSGSSPCTGNIRVLAGSLQRRHGLIPVYREHTKAAEAVDPKLRLIPVYREHTSPDTWGISEVGAHPRVQGTYLHIDSLTPTFLGSSPCTGNIRTAGLFAYPETMAHPRVQGTYLHIDSPKPSFSGSSPCTGNIQDADFPRSWHLRLIPVYREHTLPD